MNLPDIDAWLAAGCDWKQGVALYATLGTSATYQRLFSLGATDYSRQVLVRELSALVRAVAPEPVPVSSTPAAAPSGPVPASEPPVVAPAPQLLDDVLQQLNAVRDERSHLHPTLTATGTGQKRRLVIALRIMALTRQEVTLKARAAHVRQHGRLPGPVATADVSDETELRRRLLNLRSRRSKRKGQPEKLAAIEAEISIIKSKLRT